MTLTIMYLTVAFLLAALAVSTYVRVRGHEYAYGSPLAGATILLVIALIIDLAAQLTLSTQGWLLTGGTKTRWLWKVALAMQGVSIIFLVLGIWRLFASVSQIVPAGKGISRARAVAPMGAATAPAAASVTPPTNANADTTD